MPVIDANGTKINIRVEGPENAPALMFSNSLGTDLRMWDAQAAALAGDFRIIRYDNRGHGDSPAVPGDYTLEQLARDAIGVMDHLGVAKVNWCGLSLGGMVGQWIAAHEPTRIERLVLACTTSHFADKSLWADRIAAARAKGTAALADGILERWYTAPFRARDPQAVEATRAMILKATADGYAGCCTAIRDMDLRESNTRITQPTLIIAGSQDPATPPAMAEIMRDAIRGAKLVLLEAAHLSNIEQREAFTQTLRDHFAR